MSNEKFTPGPWKIKHFEWEGFPNNSIEYGESGECVAEYVANDADAKLISAAPEMYEFINWIRSVAGQCAIIKGKKFFPQILDKADELLKKARGEE